ncbi:GNAT family N-acetyltransferase [Pedobacter deserti]|uniref:GNAT family N-acetyltransferase n=1 Tax=Pedobacter deserti TaxID=2817382 RepID=UPI00210EF125|nr:GNAT family N-acetyltransferase [Pedobacter sp. SYSU D00382]
MQEFEIRSLSRSDYTELIELWEASVRATHHFLTEADIQFYRPLILNEYFDQVALFGVSDQEGVSGFIGVESNHIQMLFIHPGVRERGIGRALVSYAIDALNATQVDVNEQNEQAVGFYEHLGFRQVARADHDAAGKPYPILSMQLEKQPYVKEADVN